MTPYFSIIIPTLNEEIFLPKLITDLTKQKFDDYEILIIDGYSDDDTTQVVSKFADRLNINIYKVKKRSVSYQRNYGSTKARGKYLIFLDADARIDKAFLRKLWIEANKSQSLIYIPSIFPQDKSYQDIVVFKIVNFFIEISQTVGKPFSSGGSMIINRDFFLFLGGFNEKLYLSEDHEIIQRARARGISAKFLKNIRVLISLRRMDREGRLDIYSKYIIATIHTYRSRSGGINKKIFDYKMGGSDYNSDKKKTETFDESIRNYFTRIKDHFNRLTEVSI